MWIVNGVPVDRFESASFSLRNQSAGELRLTRAADPDAAPLWPAGAEVTLRDATGAIHFAGTVAAPADGRETAAEQRQISVTNDGWRRLERTTYLAPYPFDSSSLLDTRVLIGGEWRRVDVTDPAAVVEGAFETVIDVVPVDIAGTLRAAAAFAGAENPEIGLSGLVPTQQADPISVAGVIRAACRCFPGSVAWVDPAGRLHVRAASDLPALTIDARHVVERRVEERPELVLPGAALHVRKVRTSEGGSIEDLHRFTAGDPSAEGALIQAVELQPEVHALQIAWLEIGPASAVRPAALDWWAEYVPWIKTARAGIGDVEIVGISDGQVTPPLDPFSLPLPNVITRGAPLESFLLFGCEGPFPRRAPLVSVDARRYVVPRIQRGSASAQITINRRLPGGGVVQTTTAVTAALLFTDLSETGRYAWEDPVAFDPGEDPADFAELPAIFFRESQRLRFGGEVVIATEIPPAQLIGRALNLTGFDPRWATMAAPIHAASHDLKAGRCRLEFGAAEYLGLGDRIDMLRALKHKRPPRRRTTRFGLPPTADVSGAAPVPTPQRGEPGQAPPEGLGRIQVDITPATVHGQGARWYLEGRPEQKSGEVLAGVPAGLVTIKFTDVIGWVRPRDITRELRANELLRITGDDSRYAPAPPENPFKCTVRRRPGAQIWEVRVELESELYQTPGAGDRIAITGLGVWQPTSGPWKIFLTAEVEDELVRDGTVTISGVPGSAPWPPAVEFAGTPRKQVAFNRPIAEIVAVEGVPIVHPKTNTHLVLDWRCFDGDVALYPMPA